MFNPVVEGEELTNITSSGSTLSFFSESLLDRNNIAIRKKEKNGDLSKHGSSGIRTHAIEMTGALNQRLRPLGHTT